MCITSLQIVNCNTGITSLWQACHKLEAVKVMACHRPKTGLPGQPAAGLSEVWSRLIFCLNQALYS